MCYRLFNPKIALDRTFSRQFWAKALELAGLYGWQPAGTDLKPDYEFRKLGIEWDGNYSTNDGQVVEAGDAAAFAAALERSLDDISEENPRMDWDWFFRQDDELPEWLTPEEKDQVEEELQDGLLDIMGTHPLEFFAGEERHHLVQLIRFCRLGSFAIL